MASEEGSVSELLLACVLVICYLTSIINDQIIEDEVIYNPWRFSV